MKKPLSLLLFVVLAWPLFVFGEELYPDLPKDTWGLINVDGFRVAVNGFDKIDEDAGLSSERIRVAVELRLRSLGIQVNDRFSPYLDVRLALTDVINTQLVVYTVNVDFYNEVFVSSSHVHIFSLVWGNGFLNATGRSFADPIKEDVLILVDEFANDYLAANPPELRSGQGDE